MSTWKIETHPEDSPILLVMETEGFGYLVCELNGHINGLSYEDNLANAKSIVETHNTGETT